MTSNHAHSASVGRLTPRDRTLIAIVSLLVLLPGTIGVSLTDRDEGWYAQVSREMLVSGDWGIPTYRGTPWLAKPPLLYWCTATSFAVFGMHAWAGRLVSVLAMTGAVQVLASLTATMYGRRAALIAALGFVTAGLPAIIGKMLLTDALLLLCCLVAIRALWQIATASGGWLSCAAFWTAVGLGVLAKGPAVLVFVGAFGLALLVRQDTRAWFGKPAFWLLLPLGMLIAAPWYVYAAHEVGETFVQQLIGYEMVGRIATAPHGHTGPPGYYVLLSLAGWLPWTALVPGAVFEAWGRRRHDRHAATLLIWCGVPWLVLELIASKLPHYILPCYVPLAILLGRMWDTGLDQPVTRGQHVVLAIWAAVAFFLGESLVVLGVWHSPASWAVALIGAGLVLSVGFAIAGVAAVRLRLRTAWAVGVATTVVFHAAVGFGVLPQLERHRLSRRVAEQVNAWNGDAPRVRVLAGSEASFTEPSMYFYMRPSAEEVDVDSVRAVLDSAKPGDIVIATQADLEAAGITPWVEDPDWQAIDGFNYVKGADVRVWVVRVGGAQRSERGDSSR